MLEGIQHPEGARPSAGNFKSGHGPSTEHLLLSDGLLAVRQVY